MTDPTQVPLLVDVVEPNGCWRASQLDAFEGSLTWEPSEPELPPSEQLRDQVYDNGAWWIGSGQMAIWHPCDPVDESTSEAPRADSEKG